LTSLTSIDTVAGAEVACPSNTVKVNVSGPKKSAFGVYVTVAPSRVSNAVASLPNLEHEGVQVGIAAREDDRQRRVSTPRPSPGQPSGLVHHPRSTVTVPVAEHRGSGWPAVVAVVAHRVRERRRSANPGSGV